MNLKNETETGSNPRQFYKEYMEGMSRERLSRELSADSERLKMLYQEAVRDIETGNGKKLPGHVKIMRLFSSLTRRLNPARRLAFGVGTLSFVSYYVLRLTGLSYIFGAADFLLPVAFLSVFFLLLVELLEKSDVQKELDLARQIQLSLLPHRSISKTNLEISSFAHTALDVGGDYLDIIDTAGGTYVIIADVSGKGLSAALYMVRMQALVNMLIAREQPAPKDLFLQLNDYVKSNSKDKTFVTGCAVFFPNDKNEFELVRAGHNIPLHYSKEHDAVFEPELNGLALGMSTREVLEKHLESKRFRFESGDTLLLYTDGLTEARNSSGEEFSTKRIKPILHIYGSLHAKTTINKINTALATFIGDEPIRDDITYTCIHRPR